VQVLPALLVAARGLPVGCEMFPGNLSEGRSLQPAVDNFPFRALRRQRSAALAADAGPPVRENRALPEAHNLPYVFGFLRKSAAKSLNERIPDPKGRSCRDGPGGADRTAAPPGGHAYKVIPREGCRIVVTWSAGRERKDRANQSRRIERMKKKVAIGASPKSFSGGGHASFLEFPEGKIVVNDAKVTEAARRDGLRPVAARGNDRLPPEALLSQCR